MLKTHGNNQKEIVEILIDPNAQVLDDDLKKADHLLSDEEFLAPFIEKFNTSRGRPTIPIETYIRMMYLKHIYGLSYERLEYEVTQRISWRLFCKIPFFQRVPDGTTLIKLTHKYGDDVIKAINNLLIKKAHKEKKTKGKKLRIDTTVIKSNIHHPTDAGLLADSMRVITRTVKKIKEKGEAVKVVFRNRMGKVKKLMNNIGKFLKRRSKEAFEEVKEITSNLVYITEEVIQKGFNVLRSVKRSVRMKGEKVKEKVRQDIKNLTEKISLAKKVVDQAKEVLVGNLHIKDRIVSIFDTGARPICRGKLSEKTEFGRKLFLGETDGGFISQFEVMEGNPSDKNLVLPAWVTHYETFGFSPDVMTGDRGCYNKEIEEILEEKGVKRVVFPASGRKSKERKLLESMRWFKKIWRWRAGIEGRISHLKRKFGLGKSLYKWTNGTKNWTAWGILAYNVWNWIRAG